MPPEDFQLLSYQFCKFCDTKLDERVQALVQDLVQDLLLQWELLVVRNLYGGMVPARCRLDPEPAGVHS